MLTHEKPARKCRCWNSDRSKSTILCYEVFLFNSKIAIREVPSLRQTVGLYAVQKTLSSWKLPGL